MIRERTAIWTAFVDLDQTCCKLRFQCGTSGIHWWSSLGLQVELQKYAKLENPVSPFHCSPKEGVHQFKKKHGRVPECIELVWNGNIWCSRYSQSLEQLQWQRGSFRLVTDASGFTGKFIDLHHTFLQSLISVALRRKPKKYKSSWIQNWKRHENTRNTWEVKRFYFSRKPRKQ